MKEAIKTLLSDLAAAGIGTRCSYEEKKVKECVKKYALNSNRDQLSYMVADWLCSPNRTVTDTQVRPHIEKFLTSISTAVS